MAKEKIKEALGVTKDFSKVDTHRIIPKTEGGEYVDGNVTVIHPVEHMKKHGNYRKREEGLEKVKALMDDRRQVMKIIMKFQNQICAYQRETDTLNEKTEAWLESQLEAIKPELKAREKVIIKAIKELGKDDPLVKACLDLKGCGPITVANLITYIDFEKARHASSLWAYCGYDKPKHERYKKGVKGGGNKVLRAALYVWATVQIKQGGPYRDVYDYTKDRLSKSSRIVKTKDTSGTWVDSAWKDTKPSHRHGAAIRKMIKHFLADFWMVGRTLRGLPTDPIYAEAILGGNHKTIMPVERGWVY